MSFNLRIAMLLTIALILGGCDKILNKAGAQYLKVSMKDICGDDDPACVAAVDEQFDSCHEKYEEDWTRYMDSSVEKEDDLLRIYSEKLYGCIVDEDGSPYFFFDPE